MRAVAASVSLGLALAHGSLVAQTGQDTTRLHRLDALVVTAERTAAAIESATQAVFVLDAEDLGVRPGHTLVDALRRVPGLTFVDFDGQGTDPQLMLRGFYGGGEAEYVVLLLDGRPLNAPENGRIAWDLIPVSAIESIEIVRGPASAAWGDAAMGGVINVVTRGGAERGMRASVSGGSNSMLRGAVDLRERVGDRPLAVFGNLATSDGSRSHAERLTGALGATLSLVSTGDRQIDISTLNDVRRFDEPGPLTTEQLEVDRTSSSAFYRFDRTEERLHRIGIDAAKSLGVGARASGSVAGEYRQVDRIRTVPLAPVFADTKDRDLSTTRLLASAQIDYDELPLPGDDDLIIGVDAATGGISSEYYEFLTGDPDTYATVDGVRGDLSASGSGRRSSAALFAGYALQPTAALRLTLGARVDWLRDSFEPDGPGAESSSTTHSAFSPRAGVNLRYAQSAGHTGHLFLNVARSFKAPVLDQLYDQRTVPVPFDPFEITFANDALEPQFATSVEVGIYHRADLVPDAVNAELTLAAYHSDLRDELDFDIETLSYGNIGRSRHRGLESSLDVRTVHGIRAFARYTLQSATSRVEENKGNRLKAIPKHVLVAGLDLGGREGPAGSLQVSSAHDVYLDDANTIELPNWTRWDARFSYGLGANSLFVQVFNVFDAEFSTTGFPDAVDPGTVYYYPASGRTVSIGWQRGW